MDDRSERTNRPLAGITVVDLGQVDLAPYATLLMAKAGADVIKIESLGGEHTHERGLLEWLDHPDLGRVVVPTSPPRCHETEPVALATK